MTPPTAASWALMALCGCLWGVALSAIETLRQPPVNLSLAQMAGFMSAMWMTWTLVGLAWAGAAKLAIVGDARIRPVAVWAVLSCLLAVIQTFVAKKTIGVQMRPVIGPNTPGDALFAHVLWLNAVFGGLYVAGYAAFERAAQPGRHLARLQLALADDAARLEEIRLQALRQVLDPTILVQAVNALRARYDRNPDAGDALLDPLVIYLREAMAGSPSPGPLRAPDARAALLAELASDPDIQVLEGTRS